MSRQPVRDAAGNRYLLLKRSDESCLVRNLETGQRTHLPTEELEQLDASTLDVLLAAVPESVRTLLTAVHDERSLALLLELEADGPTPVRTLVSAYDFCERDLHGLLAELQAAGLIEEVTIAGERGYETTPTATTALDQLRESSTEQ
jgi:hypothetical protein